MTPPTFNRRDFLKLMAMLPLVRISWQHAPQLTPSGAEERRPHAQYDGPNFLILLYDTLSARHTSLDGYPRRTTPNLERFAERATVYHAHYAGGNFTNPGTASLLTGTYPWTHRSMQLYSPVLASQADKNLFRALGHAQYHSLAYSHNLVATTMLHQFTDDLDTLKKTRDLCIYDPGFSDRLFWNDYNVATWREITLKGLSSGPTSLFYGLSYKKYWREHKRAMDIEYAHRFPRGIPSHHDQLFFLEDTMDWLRDNLATLPQPFIVYFHLSPPHSPYRPSREFVGIFDEDGGRAERAGWMPVPKPEHHFSQGLSYLDLATSAKEYDEYIAYADAAFGRLYDHLRASSLADNTYLLVTSDHGEMFERGIMGHLTETLYDSVVRIPLLISAPGQEERRDVHTLTSAIDVMPTLLHVANRPIPAWCEGQILPPYRNADAADAERSIFVLEAKSNAKRRPLTKASIAMIQGRYKLIYYRGYDDFDDEYELYDLEADPEELNDIYATASVAPSLKEELLAKLEEVNAPYR